MQLKNLIFVLLILLGCSCSEQSKKDYSVDIKRNWYMNRWRPFNDLQFGDSTVFVGNSTDTVFTLNYTLSNDTLITWFGSPAHKYRHKILLLSKDSLILKGMHDEADTLKYSDTKKPYH